MNENSDLAGAVSSDSVVDEESFDHDQAVREMGDLIDDFEKVKEMPAEQFYPTNRAARRNAEKRNRALKKRKPNG